MRQYLVFLLALLLSLSSASHPGEYTSSVSWQIAPVFSMTALANGAGGKRYELGAGLQADFYLWRFGDWLLGPGLGLLATAPTNTGNNSVRVSPYSLYSEQRLSCWWALAGEHIAFLPFVSVFTNLGAEIFHRQVRQHRSMNAATLLSLGSRAGLGLWFKSWGFQASYDLSFGTNKIRQAMLIGLAYHWSD